MKISAWLIYDWPRKVCAFLFALLIWLYVHIQIQDEDVFRNLPVTLEMTAEQIVVDQAVPTVTVTVRGPKDKIKSLRRVDIEVTGKISAKAYGQSYVPIFPRNVRTPSGIHVIAVKPNRLSVDVDRIHSEEKDVHLVFNGQLPPGYDFKTRKVVPARVIVTGPEKRVKALDFVSTEPIDLGDNPPQQFNIVSKLHPVPMLTFGADEVRVTVALYQKTADRFFQHLPLFILNAPRTSMSIVGFPSANPSVDAVIQGPKATIDILTAASLRPFIDLSDITHPGIYRKSVHLWINADSCVQLQLKPMVFEVRIASRPETPNAPEKEPEKF